jgi:hypothetical protein
MEASSLVSALRGYHPETFCKEDFLWNYAQYPEHAQLDRTNVSMLEFWIQKHREYASETTIDKIRDGLKSVIRYCPLSDVVKDQLRYARQRLPDFAGDSIVEKVVQELSEALDRVIRSSD